MRYVLLALVALVLAGCSGGSDEPDATRAEDSGRTEDSTSVDLVEDLPGVTDVVGETNAPDLPGPDIPADDALVDTLMDGKIAEVTEDAVDEVVDPPPEYHPLFDFASFIEVTEFVLPGGQLEKVSASVRLMDGPPKVNQGLLKAIGSCEYFSVFAVPQCKPACDDEEEFCGVDLECHPFHQRVSAGEVEFKGLSLELTAVPDDTAAYSIPGGFPTQDLFGPDSEIKVSAKGDEAPGFDVELGGVGDMVAGFGGTYTLEDGHDNEITWVPQDDGATVEVAIRTGWHGKPAISIIWCTAPDAAGKITIPQELVEMFPPTGDVGLWPWPSFIRRVKRKVIENPFGLVEVRVASEDVFGVVH